MIRYDTVSFGTDIVTIDFRNPCLHASSYQGVKHGVLHVASQYPAAHQPEFDVKRLELTATNDYRYKSIITEFVCQSSVRRDVVGVGRNAFNIGKSVAFCCQVKLICFVNELRDSIKVDGLERGYSRAHIQ